MLYFPNTVQLLMVPGNPPSQLQILSNEPNLHPNTARPKLALRADSLLALRAD